MSRNFSRKINFHSVCKWIIEQIILGKICLAILIALYYQETELMILNWLENVSNLPEDNTCTLPSPKQFYKMRILCAKIEFPQRSFFSFCASEIKDPLFKQYLHSTTTSLKGHKINCSLQQTHWCLLLGGSIVLP